MVLLFFLILFTNFTSFDFITCTQTLWPVWLMILNGDNGNDLYYKISSKVLYHFHGNETLIKKSFFVYKFPYHLIPLFPMIMHWNEFYEKDEMIEIEQTLPSR